MFIMPVAVINGAQTIWRPTDRVPFYLCQTIVVLCVFFLLMALL